MTRAHACQGWGQILLELELITSIQDMELELKNVKHKEFELTHIYHETQLPE